MTNDARIDAGVDPRAFDDSSVFWDERYRSADALWSGQPNPQLVTEAADLAPGTALDAGCGEGEDALWLAACGWQVTAVDISTVALERGAAHARAIGMDVAERITWLQADLTNWVPAAASYDLVSAQFLHLPREPRDALFRRLAAAVAPGGSLLIVGHHPSDLQIIPRPLSPDRFFTAPDIAALLDPHGWDIVVSAARDRGAADPAGRPVIIHDAVLRARRGA
ncbi:MAG: SAM-dependent methyltransferase [Chloroflexota bacterium]